MNITKKKKKNLKMNKKIKWNVIFMTTPKITKTQYDDLKNNYLNKNRSLHSLYIELNKDNTINRQLFFKLINKIRLEEGLEEYYTKKKEKRKNNIITFSDKSPNSYN